MSSSVSRLRGQDALTIKLNDILKRALDLKAHIEAIGWTVADSPPPISRPPISRHTSSEMRAAVCCSRALRSG